MGLGADMTEGHRSGRWLRASQEVHLEELVGGTINRQHDRVPARQDFTVGTVPIESGVDDPTRYSRRIFYRRRRSYGGYSDADFDKLVEATFRSVLFYPAGASCWQPWIKGSTMMSNSVYTAGTWKMCGSTAKSVYRAQC